MSTTKRGDVILAVMQAQRAYRAETSPLDASAFDEAHAVADRLIADGIVAIATPATGAEPLQDAA